MMQQAFHSWLMSNNYSRKTISNYTTQCKWVEDNCGDLDEYFEQETLGVILDKLTFWNLMTEEINPLCAMISGDCKSNLGTYRSSVKLYFKFREDGSSIRVGASGSVGPTPQSRSILANRGSDWPEWNLPNDEEQLHLAAIAVPYIRFLRPEIVRAVVEDNEIHRERWTEELSTRGIDPSLYLWRRSSCAFPGVRRHSGSTEIAQFKGRVKDSSPVDALDLDGNAYPKAIWSFVFRGKPFQNVGPVGYALAHLADHKSYKNRGPAEFSGEDNIIHDHAIFGLYSSVSNTAYVPTSLIRPTDFGFELRSLLQRKATNLYGSFCNLLPPQFSFRSNDAEAWSLDAFRWSEPVGTMNHVTAFLAYRQERIERLLAIDRSARSGAG